ncbi:SPW repeat-containing protein [Pseudoduganella lurida]|uniref:SPW repeat-containing protein n=1 Tax=Pseudoduganella lurida TaxID=1036180 RepID=A0A562R3P8_9BURK|nr:SPW repeat protein [Pseudoduganella lurida]TWI63687.1 SPW repeat-containing protein [Pseudoduganella lurida]
MAIALKRWQDQLILLLGIWLFITPWIFSYVIPSPHAWNAFLCGAVLAVLAACDLYKTYLWAVIVNLAIGIWVAVSPWVLVADYGQGNVMLNNLLVGLAAAVLAAWELTTDPELHKKWPGAGAAT